MASFITLRQAAELTGLSTYYLRKRCREGSLPILKVGSDRRGTYFLDAEALVTQLRAEARRDEEGVDR